jgi:phage baseplate assembly protein V
MAYGDALAKLIREVAELKRVQANTMRVGTVHEVDAAKGMVRLKYGERKGKPVLGPWRPWMEQGGALKTWKPPTVGQTMMSFNPQGDQRQGVILNSSFSDQNQQPSSQGSENVVTYGPFKGTLKANDLLLEMGGAKLRMRGNAINLVLGGSEIIVTNGAINIKSSLVLVEGSQLFHNVKNVGDTHRHGGVIPGGANTDVPA